MSRKLTPQSSLENLKREAKRWLKAIRDNDPEARARLARAYDGSTVRPEPTLRDVQHALAREHGLSGWTALKAELLRTRAALPASRDEAITALLSAAGHGDVATVKALLAEYSDIVNVAANLEGNTGRRTALHYGSGHEAVVRTLLEHGADPNVRDEGDEAMPLHFAAERGDLAVVKLLIEHGADPVGDGTTHLLNVLGWATCFGYAYHGEVAAYLLAHGARHTMHTAVAMGDVQAIRDIAARTPADLDRAMDTTNRHRRPLHLAVIKKRPESLATLLDLGAATETEDMAGLTALDLAAISGEMEMARLLVARGARLRLPAAIALERPDDVQRLLREEPDALRPGGRWDRLIIRASESGPARLVESLIRAGASVHIRDHHSTAVDNTHSFTALHAAVSGNNLDAARVLLAHGADPAVREDKYWGTPVGWADYLDRPAMREVLLGGPIDIFDAVTFRPDRIDEILTRDPDSLDRPFAQYVNGDPKSKPWLDAKWTPIAYAIAHGKTDAARMLAERGANLELRDSKGRTPAEMAREVGHPDLADFLGQLPAIPGSRRAPDVGWRRDSDSHPSSQRVADFLDWACTHWRTSGAQRDHHARDALRLLQREPEIARANIHTAVVAGELDEVRRLLAARSTAATEIGGPRSWPPLLYLCTARLPFAAATENAVEIARLLLDNGADPNAFYHGGNADIHYTALTCVLGRGEEMAPMHPRAPELTRLLLERGADPHDNQVLYNVFADNTSRDLLDNDIIWLLDLMFEHSVRRGHKADWDDPEWPMFDMRGAPSLGHEERRHPGSHLMLSGAVDRNLIPLATWMLEHGAGPNTPPGRLWGIPQRTLYQDALLRGHTEMAELLARYGAKRTPLELDEHQAFIDACFKLDRERAQALVARHPDMVKDHRPMFEAVRRDRVDVVEMLLDLGWSPDVEDPHGRVRPLHIASWGAEQCAELLIARGADVDARDANYDSPPLGWAAWGRKERMIELLGRHSRDVWFLTYTGRIERLREVLHEEPQRARVVSKDGYGTPLMWLPADEDTAMAIARLFLELGADTSRKTAEGLTAADIARRRGMDRVAEALAPTAANESARERPRQEHPERSRENP